VTAADLMLSLVFVILLGEVVVRVMLQPRTEMRRGQVCLPGEPVVTRAGLKEGPTDA
jgi:hypothetical protein